MRQPRPGLHDAAAKVGTGAKTRAAPGDHDATYFAIRLDLVDHRLKRLQQLRRHRVAVLGAIQRDLADQVSAACQHRGLRHGVSYWIGLARFYGPLLLTAHGGTSLWHFRDQAAELSNPVPTVATAGLSMKLPWPVAMGLSALDCQASMRKCATRWPCLTMMTLA